MAFIIEKLQKSYPTPSEPLQILKSIDLTLNQEDAVAIMGPSGSGKSTLLHILGTLDRPTSGKIELNHVNPFELKEKELAQFRNEKIGFIFQDHHLLPQFTVLENVLLPTLVNRWQTPIELENRARELLHQVGLSERLTHRPAELSGGERQRVAVARSLMQNPKLLLADEPTGNLDQAHAEQIGRLLLQLHQQLGMILIVVTHSSELAGLFPKKMEMKNGQLFSNP